VGLPLGLALFSLGGREHGLLLSAAWVDLRRGGDRETG
jgi:hypothetical protein